ncbi:MAG: hypothetical protein Q8L34_00570, partial [Candidatus Woesearchaeota archaeon]|nr:hypothetical protein [Candidatus Woesearchaeota archaeon]
IAQRSLDDYQHRVTRLHSYVHAIKTLNELNLLCVKLGVDSEDQSREIASLEEAIHNLPGK